MEADLASFNGSNKHKSLCQKIKRNSPVLILGDITFYLSHVLPGKGASVQPSRQTGEQRFVRAAKSFLRTTSKLGLFYYPSSMILSPAQSLRF